MTLSLLPWLSPSFSTPCRRSTLLWTQSWEKGTTSRPWSGLYHKCVATLTRRYNDGLRLHAAKLPSTPYTNDLVDSAHYMANSLFKIMAYRSECKSHLGYGRLSQRRIWYVCNLENAEGRHGWISVVYEEAPGIQKLGPMWG